jgi:hypothetical protein
MVAPLLLFLLFAPPAAVGIKFQCDRPVDLVYVTDESGSINLQTQWPLLIGFIAELSTAFPSTLESTRGVQLAYVGYDASLTPNQVPLPPTSGSIVNNTLFSERVSLFSRRGGGTQTFRGIAEAGRQLLQTGRPPSAGVSRLVIVLTDGDTNGGEAGTDQTIAAADALRDVGITVAAVPVGTIVASSTRAQREMRGIVGGDESLLFPVEDWAGLDNDVVVLDALARVACEAPVAPEAVNRTIDTSVTCNTTVFISWLPALMGDAALASPISIRGQVQGGIFRICWSYFETTPLLRPGMPNTTFCSVALPGVSQISTLAAFPPAGRGPSGEARPLHASLTALNVTNATSNTWTCGGTANITSGFCFARIATQITPQPGTRGGAPPPPPLPPGALLIATAGTPEEARCPSCPPNNVLLSPFSAGDEALGGVCSPSCLGGAQYISPPLLERLREDFRANESTFSVCRDCHASCDFSLPPPASDPAAPPSTTTTPPAPGGACTPPPALLPLPQQSTPPPPSSSSSSSSSSLPAPPIHPSLLCTACRSGALLNSSTDPALTSPHWVALYPLLAPSPPALWGRPSTPFFLPPPEFLAGAPGATAITSGRCLAAGTPSAQSSSSSSGSGSNASSGTVAPPGECLTGLPGVIPPTTPTSTAPLQRATPVCPPSTPRELAARSTTLLITLCLPRPPEAPPTDRPLMPPYFPPAAAALTPTCAAYLATPAAAGALTQLAAILRVPPATLFLRSCLDTGEGNPGAAPPTLSGVRHMWAWDNPSPTSPSASLPVPGARGALLNATARAGSNCSCNAIATYALVLGAGEPGQFDVGGALASAVRGGGVARTPSGDVPLPPLPALITGDPRSDPAVYGALYDRAVKGLALLAASALNTTAGVPVEPLGGGVVGSSSSSSSSSTTRSGGGGGGGALASTPTGGFPALKCSPASIQLLAACYDDSDLGGGGG